jgi:hypothetical protein
MNNVLSFTKAAQLSSILFSMLILFHAAIIAGIIFFDYAPVDFLWGGRLKTREELLVFEIISLLVGIVCLLAVQIRAGRIKLPGLQRTAGVVLWILVLIFLLNTVGNLLAKTTFEKFFAIVTGLLAILCLRLALERVASRQESQVNKHAS